MQNSNIPQAYQPNVNGVSAIPDASTTASNNNLISQIPNQPTTTPSTVPVDKGNWFTHLLPTIGSIAAPALGALFAPETGGLSLLAGLAGGTALAGAGSAGGKAIENVVEGNQQNAGDLGMSALEGAGGNLLGAGVGKVLGLGGDVAKGLLAKSVENNAAKTAAEDLAQNTKDIWLNAGNKGFLKANDLAGTQKLATSLGVDANSPLAFSQTGKAANNILGTNLDEALAKSGTVDTNEMNNIIKNSINDKAGVLGSTDMVAKSAGKFGLPNNPATQLLSQLKGITAGIADNPQADPLQVRDVISQIGKLIPDAKPGISASGAKDPVQVAIYNTLNDIYNKLKTSLYDRPEVTNEISKITGNIQPTDVGGNQLLANHLNTILTGSKTPQDLLDHLSQFSKMNNLGQAGTESLRNPATAAALNMTKRSLGTPSSAPSTNGLVDLASVAGMPFTGGLSAIGLIPHAIKAISSPGVQDAALKLMNSGVSKKIASAIPAALTGASQFLTHAPDQTATPVNLHIGDNSMNPQPANDPNSTNNLLMNFAIASMANGNQGGSSLLSQILGANRAQSALTGAENAFQQAGGGQGGIMGNVQKFIGGITGNPASQYEQQRQSLMNLLQGTPQAPGIAPGQTLPDITGNNASAINQFRTLQNIIQNNNGSAIPSM